MGKKKDWYMCMIAMPTCNASLLNHNLMAPSHPQTSDENHDIPPTFFSSRILDIWISSSPRAAQMSIQVGSEQYSKSHSARRVNKNKNFIFWPQRQMHALQWPMCTCSLPFSWKCLAAEAVIQAVMVCIQNTTITQQGTN